MENDNICSICYDSFNEDEVQSYTLDCSHKYHSQCIIQWFRNGNSKCPLCNDIKLEEDLSYGTKLSCISEIKNLGKRKDCPIKIKKILENIKKIDLEIKESKKKYTEFKKENKEILKELNKLSSKRWKGRRKIRALESKLLGYVTLNPIYIIKKK